ncbi:MAG: hypothetical protein K6F50_00735 [Kiritimatiellae bacterium]|nr:hypothetical protein [Kiritimatiellia bacterium]
MKVPEGKTIILTIVSHQMKDERLRWAVNITFKGGLEGSDAILPITVEDGLGQPIPAAVFEFAGKDLRVRDGKSSMTYGDFIKGKHKPGIWLKRRGEEPVPGSLTFA